MSVQQAEVPLLEGDAVDHHQVVQVVLSCGCSSWDPPHLQEGGRQTLDTGYWSHDLVNMKKHISIHAEHATEEKEHFQQKK